MRYGPLGAMIATHMRFEIPQIFDRAVDQFSAVARHETCLEERLLKQLLPTGRDRLAEAAQEREHVLGRHIEKIRIALLHECADLVRRPKPDAIQDRSADRRNGLVHLRRVPYGGRAGSAERIGAHSIPSFAWWGSMIPYFT